MKYFIDNNGDNLFVDITEEQEKFLYWCIEKEIIDEDFTHIHKLDDDVFETV